MAENPFDFEPRSDQEEAELDKARDARDERQAQRQKVEGDERRSNRILGVFVLLFAFALIAGGIFLYNPYFPWESVIGYSTSMSMKVLGLILGLQGFRMLIFATKE